MTPYLVNEVGFDGERGFIVGGQRPFAPAGGDLVDVFFVVDEALQLSFGDDLEAGEVGAVRQLGQLQGFARQLVSRHAGREGHLGEEEGKWELRERVLISVIATRTHISVAT